MATAYTPGLRVSPNTLVKKQRMLPLKGDVTVEEGQEINSHEIVARTDLPGAIYPKNTCFPLILCDGRILSCVLPPKYS